MSMETEVHTTEAIISKEQLPSTPLPSDDNASASTESPDILLPPPSTNPSAVLDIDKTTPDCHVPRDSRLIRLTGVHPFNVEAPLSALYDEGFLTTPELFYVRNHGAVPKVLDEEIIDWELSIEGLVENPMILTVKQILDEFEQITVPVTLACAGNRRKEQNQVRKTKGFSWGAAGVSTALFTGPVMADVIRRAKPSRRAKYVCMEGADKLPNGYYGTSVKLNWVMDSNRGIMLAHKMNSEPLRPDHGRPLRAVVPGQIGGRSVKWLKKLIVTDAPSDNWYHIYDNRVLPTMVSPDEAAKDSRWWKDERYAIFDLAVNSAITYPAHNERLPLGGSTDKYNVRGYAYSGGGRRVTRVEISIDKGRTWRLSNIEYPEDTYRETDQNLYGGRIDMSWRETCFCWCLWSLDVPFSELKDRDDILVRAMDEAMNIQPRDMYWSVLGMMNNCWFRVAITKEGDSLRFEHPTQPALQPGGWMERIKKAGGDLINGRWGKISVGEEAIQLPRVEEVKMTKDDLIDPISIDDLRKHDAAEEPWFVVNGEVYNGTAFLNEHPGGAQSIISAAALDVTDEFMAIHSETAKAMMTQYHIGSLDDAGRIALMDDGGEEEEEKREYFLRPRSWTKALLWEKRIVSWDTRVFSFKLDHDEQTLGLPIGQHLMLRIKDPVTQEVVIRSYTPISETKKKGVMDLLIKIYFTTNTTQGGKMTMAMDKLSMGGTVEFKGPIGKFEYLGRGRAMVSGRERQVKSFCMICAGSGITPIFQVYRAVMQDPDDKTHCLVLDGNRLVEDILCKSELDDLAAGNEHRCKVLYTLTRPPEDWTGLKGRISEELIRSHVVPDDNTLILVCGPEALEKSIHGIMLAQGWKDSDVVFF